jgi:16S rRNA (guanine(966)-N(2))-methyltransferase RsmD
MRVISGKYGSRVLRSLRGLELRPTSDRLRETLFNILGDGVAGAVFVDAYAGTGAVGIEALSRGAARVIFIEKHREAAALVKKNLEELGAQEQAEVLKMDAMRGLEMLEARGVHADFVFLDPPWEKTGEYARVLEFLGGRELLEDDARVIAEARRTGKERVELADRYGRLQKTREVGQGDAVLVIYRAGA